MCVLQFCYRDSTFHHNNYYIKDKTTIEDLLSKFVGSPIDKIVNDCSDLMDELT